ncbi:MAG: hypothetical protein R6T90_03580 [Dissulfuribacterales bacterium]
MYNFSRLEMDHLFSSNNLGEVRLENPDYPGVWKTDEQDYVSILVPHTMQERFTDFWDSAGAVLGEKLKVLHVQENSPLSDGYFIEETWYFITCETAMEIMDRFDMIMEDTLIETCFG